MIKSKFKLILMLLSLSSICILSCRDDDTPYPAGIQTAVSGNVFDSKNNIPASNVTLNVGEYIGKATGSGALHYHFVEWVGTTQTDQDGNYNLIFQTSGKGSLYRVEIQENQSYWSGIFSSYKDIKNIGSSFNANFDILHLYPALIKITLNNVDYLPITPIFDTFNKFNPVDLLNISSNNVEETREIYIDKNSPFTVEFSRKKPDGKYQRAYVNLPATGTANLTEHTITLSNADFVNYPY